MSNVSFGGLATGMDTATIVAKLMEVERGPEKLLQARQAKFQSQADTYGKIKSALSTLQGLAQGMNTSANFKGMLSTVADANVATVSASSTATPGVHSLEVISLARSQRQVSTGYALDAVFNTGTLSIDNGTGTVTTVTIAEGQNTLQGIASAINGSGANLTASIINDGSGTPGRLVLTGKDTSNYTVDFSNLTTSPASGAPDLVPTLLGAGDPSYQAGTPASFKLDGILISKSSNTVSDALPGVTLNLVKEGGSTTFNVSNDTAGVTKKISDFVAAYNSAITLVNKQSVYDASGKNSGVLSGDATLRTIQTKLRSLLTTPVSGATGTYSTLAELGITSSRTDGTLSVDSAKLTKALSSDFANVVDLFTHNTGSGFRPTNEFGIAEQFNQVIEGMVHSYVSPGSPNNGLIESRVTGLKKTISDIDRQVSIMEERIAKMQSTMQKRFAAMESMISNLQSQGNSMLAALGSMTKSSSSSSSS